MLNSVARYLWGSDDAGDQPQGVAPPERLVGQQAAQGEDGGSVAEDAAAQMLATHHDEDDDWIVVGLSGQGDSAASLQPSTEANAPSNSPSRTADLASPAAADPHARLTTRDTPARPACTQVGHRSGGAVHHVEVSSPEQLVRITRAAQHLQHSRAQKMITGQKCERQNKVRDFKSHPKGKSNNRRSKTVHASGAKCSRYNQRV